MMMMMMMMVMIWYNNFECTVNHGGTAAASRTSPLQHNTQAAIVLLQYRQRCGVNLPVRKDSFFLSSIAKVNQTWSSPPFLLTPAKFFTYVDYVNSQISHQPRICHVIIFFKVLFNCDIMITVLRTV
jgi:hypothetical protein